MKYYATFLLLVFTFYSGSLRSQSVIAATSPTHGCDTLTVTFSLTTTLTPTTIIWDFGDSNIETLNTLTAKHKYSKHGTYTVRAYINGTDTAENINLIQISAIPEVGFTILDTISDSPLHLFLKAGVRNIDSVLFMPLQFEWFIEGVPSGNSRILDHTFDSIGKYRTALIVSNSEGCVDTFRNIVQVIDKLRIPNVFSPNNDGNNDQFIISTINGYTLKFQVFNRNGLLLFKTQAKRLIWDGKLSSGEDVPEGIYYYLIEAENSNPPIKEKGFVYIFR